MKTKEELNAIKEEYEDVKDKLAELTDEELEQVMGGIGIGTICGRYCKYCNKHTIQVYLGNGAGYDSKGSRVWCDLYLCKTCNCTNYYEANSDIII